MNNLINLILQNGGDAAIGQIARKFGLPQEQTSQILAMLAPALSQGIKRNLNDSRGLGELSRTLTDKTPRKVLEQPEMLEQDDRVVEQGNAILGQLFGSKDVSRTVASRVADQAGTDPGIVKQLLPIAATLAMGALGKESQKRGAVDPNAPAVQVEETTIIGTVMEFIDMDDDGSVVDDLFDIARKFF